jgi:hypothetical protein
MTFTFDPSLNLGNLLVLVSILATMGLALRRLGRMEQRLDLIWKWFLREHDLNGHEVDQSTKTG